MSQNNKPNNTVNVYTSSEPGGLTISALSDVNKTLDITNNKAQYFSELAKKYKDETKTLMEIAKQYAEQNSDVTKEYVDTIAATLERSLASKEELEDYALSSDLPVKVSDLTNDTGFITLSSVGNGTITLSKNNETLGSFTTNQSSNLNIDIPIDLSGKADVDLTNATPVISFAAAMNNAGIRTIVEAYSNGTSWYRVWSDKWCEQGGTNTDDTNIVITLLKPYRDTNYSVIATPASNNTKNANFSAAIGTRTTTQFNISFSNSTTGNSCNHWLAYGYIN